MSWIKRIFGSKPSVPRFEGRQPVEWMGATVEVQLEGRAHPKLGEWLHERRRRMVWAAVDLVENKTGKNKLVFHVAGHIVGEFPAYKLRDTPDLWPVLQAGVNVAIISVSVDEHPSAIFGREFKYRPRPPWV